MPPQDKKSLRNFWLALGSALALNAVLAGGSIYVTQARQEVFIENQKAQIIEMKSDIKELRNDIKMIIIDKR